MMFLYSLIINFLPQEYKRYEIDLVETTVREWKIPLKAAQNQELKTKHLALYTGSDQGFTTMKISPTKPDWGSNKLANNSNKHPSFDKGKMEQNALIKQTKPSFLHKSDWGFFLQSNFLCSVEQRRNYFQNLIQPYLTSDSTGLVMGMVFGGAQNLEKSFKSQVKVTGLSHILSASGSNVSLVLLINSPYLRRRFGNIFTTIISILAVILFLSTAGCTAPLIRASFTAVFALLGHSLWKRKLSQIWLLGISCAVMIAISADYLTSISFQLSVAACLGLLHTTKLFPNKSREYLDVSISSLKGECYQSMTLIAKFSRVLSGFHSFTKNLRRWVLVTVQSTLAIQFFTLPIIVFTFHELSILSVVSNVAVIWLVPFIVAFTLLTLSFSFFDLSVFAFFFGQLTELFSNFFISVVSLLGSNSKLLLQLSDSQSLWFLLIYFLLVLILLVRILDQNTVKIPGRAYLCH